MPAEPEEPSLPCVRTGWGGCLQAGVGEQERKEVPGKEGKQFTPEFLAHPLKQMLMCFFAPWLIPSSSHS